MLHIFIMYVTAPIRKVTAPFSHVLTISYRPLNKVFVFICQIYFDQNFVTHSIIMIDPSSVFTDNVLVYLYLFTLTYIPPTQYVIYREYHVSTKDYLDWNFSLVLWYVDCTTNATAARIPIHRSESSTYIYCRLYVHTRLPSNWCILYIIAFACGFPEKSGLVLITYSFYIKLF